MALQGTFYGTTANVRITPIIEWSAVQSVAGNYSDITATLSYTKKNSNPTTGGRWTGGLTIGEDTKKVSSQYIEVYQDKITQVMTHTVRVYHDSYGKATVTISATGGITNPSSSTLQDTKISATVTLDTIPRATTIAAGKADIESNLIIALDRKNSSFTHSIQYRFGNLTGYIDSNGNSSASEVKLQNANPWFTLPAAFYAQIPDDPEGEGTLYCRTYSGSTQIGSTQQTPFTAVASKAKCSPGLTWNITDINEKTTPLTGNPEILIKGHSIALCEVTGDPKNSAEISLAKVNGTEVSLDDKYYGYKEIVPSSEKISFYVKDSRGYDCTKPGSRTMIPYIDLTCNVEAVRTDPVSGKAQLKIWGKYFDGSFTAVENTLSLKYSIAGGDEVTLTPEINGENYAVTVSLEGLDYQTSHSVEVVAEDKLLTLTKPATIGKGIPVFDWGENDFRFNVPVYLQEGILADYVVETGTASMGDNGIWYWTKWASGKAECYGCRNYGDLDVSTAWGSLYRTALMSQSLPSGLFVSAPNVIHITIGSTDNGGWVAFDGKKVSKASVGQFMVLRGVTAIMAQTHLGFHIIGRWK